MSNHTIEEGFGDEFAREYKIEAKKRTPMLKLVGAVREEFINAAKANITPKKRHLNYPMSNGMVYHIMLVESGEELTTRELKWDATAIGPFKFSQGNLFCNIKDPALLEMIQPSSAYVIVGLLKSNPGVNGKVWHNFRLDGIITMDEIKACKAEPPAPVEDDT